MSEPRQTVTRREDSAETSAVTCEVTIHITVPYVVDPRDGELAEQAMFAARNILDPGANTADYWVEVKVNGVTLDSSEFAGTDE